MIPNINDCLPMTWHLKRRDAVFWIFFNSRFLLDEKEYDDNMRDLFPDSVYSLTYLLDAVFWISLNSRWNCKFLIRCEEIFMIDLFPDSVFSLNYFLVCTSHQQHWLHLTLTYCKYIFSVMSTGSESSFFDGVSGDNAEPNLARLSTTAVVDDDLPSHSLSR